MFLSHLYDLAFVKPFEQGSYFAPRRVQASSDPKAMVNTRASGKKVYAGLQDKKKIHKRDPRPARRPAALPVPPAPAPSHPPAAPKGYVDKASGKDTPMSPPADKPGRRMSKTLSPGGVSKSRSGSKQKTPPPSGGISKSRSGSKQKTPPPSPVDSSLIKRKGKLVSNELQVNPERVLEGSRTNRFPPVELPDAKGLRNWGNTCYQNSMLQVVFHTPAFYRYLGKIHKNCKIRTHECLVCSLQYLAQAYWNMEEAIRPSYAGRIPGPLEPQKIFNNAIAVNFPDAGQFPDLAADMKDKEESDPWEFLRYLLHAIKGKELPSDDARYDDTLRFSTVDSWTCDECEYTSTHASPDDSLEPFIDLEIRLPKRGLTMMEYLQRHFQDNRIEARCEGEYAWKKQTSKHGPVRVQKRSLRRFPEVLIIRLQRFLWTGGSDERGGAAATKIVDDVQFDEYLNMGPFAADGEDTIYRLDGVVSHAGRGANSGHYVASVRNINAVDFTFVNDDVRVGETLNGRGTFLEMQSPNSQSSRFSPYLLVYSKI